MEFIEFSAKTVEDAVTAACQNFSVTSEKLEIEVVEEGKAGIFGLGAKPAIIKARVKATLVDNVKSFLKDVFAAMKVDILAEVTYDEEERNIDINLVGENVGMLIGKRGQTLDSLQYLVSLVVNKETDNYIRVKVDTENYRERRKATLENLAKNMAHKVKRIHKSVSLESMNPYERRIIHAALQDDKYVTTHSEGDEPYRRVVIAPKKSYNNYRNYNK